MRREKGSALIAVILVILVLTMVGIAGLLFMTIEDRLSGNDILQKEGLYIADTGLRQAEAIVFQAGRTGINTELQYISPSPTPSDPSLGLPSPGSSTQYTLQAMLLGTVLQGFEVMPLGVTPAGYSGFYTVYIRNNQDDYGGTSTTDGDGRVNLVCRAWLEDGNSNVVFERYVEEQMNLGNAGGAGSTGSQAGSAPSGTGQVS